MSITALAQAVRGHERLVVLTGAGVSAASGIPTYRNDRGDWLHSEPIQHQTFVSQAASRRRYWARSIAGWPHFSQAEPNTVHYQLAELERAGYLNLLVTQNVDRLHQRAGHEQVVDLHGRLDRVQCLDCGATIAREYMQTRLFEHNPGLVTTAVGYRADGDAEIAEQDVAGLQIPACEDCGGILMPTVVFFGGAVDRFVVEQVNTAIQEADALLAIGSSLSVYSGFRFCRLAAELGKPLYIVNRGQTRADELAILKVIADCGTVVRQLHACLTVPAVTTD